MEEIQIVNDPKELQHFLIMGIVSGSRTNYRLNPERISELRSLAEHFFDEIGIDPKNINC